MQGLVILDRDGVINQDSDHYIKNPMEWQAIPGSLEAIARLNQQNYYVAVATNQSGLARGLFDEDDLKAIHHKMHTQLKACNAHIDYLTYCPHHPDDHCHCRKPKPGMLLDIFNHSGLSPRDAYFVGDKYADLQAARLAGCQPILVKTGRGASTFNQYPDLIDSVQIFPHLVAFVDELIAGVG